jgi:hypothetical protein
MRPERSPKAPPPAFPHRSARPTAHALGLLALALALAFALYGPTLRLSWAYDDIDFLNEAAVFFTDDAGPLHGLLAPHAEHILAGFRVVFHACLELFGLDATPYRVVVLVAHALGGLFVGLLARHYAGVVAGVAATVLYVGASGLSSLWIWFPSGGGVPLGTAFLLAAAALVAGGRRRNQRAARIGAGVAVVLGLLCESVLAPLALLPVVVDEWERRRAGARALSIGLLAVFVLGTAAAFTVGAALTFGQTYGSAPELALGPGFLRAMFLLAVTPFRLAFPGIPMGAGDAGRSTAVLGSVLGSVVGGAALAGLLTLWRGRLPELVKVAALAAAGPLAWVGIVGLRREGYSFADFYDADRYFYPLLVPLALLAGAAAAGVAQRLATWTPRQRQALLLLLLAVTASELWLHRRAMLSRIPFHVYDAHERRLDQMELLGEKLAAAARKLPPGQPPLRVPDGRIWFPDVHNGQLSTRLLVGIVTDGAGGRLALGMPTVGERDAGLLQPVLEEWARAIGQPLPYLSIVEGTLHDAHVVDRVDFRAAPHDGAVVSGFHGWEGSSRWMGRQAELRMTVTCTGLSLVLAAPVEALQRRGVPAPVVAVSVEDEATGLAADLGVIQVTSAEPVVYPLSLGPFNSRFGLGRNVRLVLRASGTWRPADVLPGSGDERELSVAVLAAGCPE